MRAFVLPDYFFFLSTCRRVLFPSNRLGGIDMQAEPGLSRSEEAAIGAAVIIAAVVMIGLIYEILAWAFGAM